VGPTCRRQFPSPAHSLSLYLAGPVRQCLAVAPARPLFSLYVVGLPCQFRLLHARRGPTCVHSRTSPGFSATMPAHVPSSLFRAPPVPHAHPSPHFTHPRPLSRYALAARRRRRPSLASPAIQIAGDRSKPPRAPPEVRHPSPCPISLIVPYVRPISPSPVLDRGGPPCSRGGRPIQPGLVPRSSSLCHPCLY
jgi:hypothetical protein